MATESGITRTACLQCRQIKVRCDKVPNDSRCSRCLRLNFQCEFRRHARGRKPKSAFLTQTSPRSEPFNVLLDNDRSAPPPPSNFESPETEQTSGTLSLKAELTPITISGTTQPTESSSSSTNGNSRQSVVIATGYHENALSEEVIVDSEARRLMEFFFRELNTMIALFDPYLHTLHYTMTNYPLVFSSIIAVAAKFSRPDLFPACSEICNRLMALAAAEDLCNLDHIQALSILSFWKESGDTTSWRKIGRAIRMAFELDLHISHLKNTNEPDEIVNREIMNRQRTWMQLCCFDTAFTNSVTTRSSRPEMIPLGYRLDAYAWYMAHRDWALPGDSRLVCSLELDIVRRDIQALKDAISSKRAASLISTLSRIAQSRVQSFRDRWMTEKTILPLNDCTSAQCGYLLEIFNLKLDEVIWQHQQNTNVPIEEQNKSFARCVYDASTILRMLVDRVATTGYLRACQDWTIFGSAYAGKWLYVQRDRINGLTLRETTGVFNEVISVCSNDSRSDDEPLAYLSRFYQAMLPPLNERRRSLSRSSAGEMQVPMSNFSPTKVTAAAPVPAMLSGSPTNLPRVDIAPTQYALVKPVNLNNMENLQDSQNQSSTSAFIDLFVQDADYWDSIFSNFNTI